MIRAATKDDIDQHLASRGMVIEGESRIPVYIAELDGCTMMFTVEAFDNDAECHIAIPRRSIKKSRELLEHGIEFVQFLGFERVFTGFEQKYKTAHNMLMKSGFEYVGTYDNLNFYERSLTCQQQQ